VRLRLLKVFIAMAPASIPKIQQASLDLRVVVVAVALSIVSGAAVVFGPRSPMPDRRLTRITHERHQIPHPIGLVTAQIALAVMMLEELRSCCAASGN